MNPATANSVCPLDHLATIVSPSFVSAPTGAPVVNRVEIRPLRKTFVRVVVDNHGLKPAIDRWINPSDGPVMLRGQHFSIHVDRDAVEITKDGKPLSSNDPNVTIE